MKIRTGINVIDSKWGGVYCGGNYLIFGFEKSGKTVLNLNLIDTFIKNGKKVLYFTSERAKNLEIFFSAINLNLKELILNENFKIEKISHQISSIEMIKKTLDEFSPDILLIDKITNKNISFIFDDFVGFVEHLENMNITLFYTSSVPQDKNLRLKIKQSVKTATGIINLKREKYYSGKIKLIPNYGHFEGEIETDYKVKSGKGFTTTIDKENNFPNDSDSPMYNFFEYSNVYSFEEFKTLLESKSAMCNKTDKKANIISYEILDEKINIIELCKVFREHLEDSDKITYKNNKVYILPSCEERDKLYKLTKKLSEKAQESFTISDKTENYIRENIKQLENDSNF